MLDARPPCSCARFAAPSWLAARRGTLAFMRRPRPVPAGPAGHRPGPGCPARRPGDPDVGAGAAAQPGAGDRATGRPAHAAVRLAVRHPRAEQPPLPHHRGPPLGHPGGSRPQRHRGRGLAAPRTPRPPGRGRGPGPRRAAQAVSSVNPTRARARRASARHLSPAPPRCPHQSTPAPPGRGSVTGRAAAPPATARNRASGDSTG